MVQGSPEAFRYRSISQCAPSASLPPGRAPHTDTFTTCETPAPRAASITAFCWRTHGLLAGRRNSPTRVEKHAVHADHGFGHRLCVVQITDNHLAAQRSTLPLVPGKDAKRLFSQ